MDYKNTSAFKCQAWIKEPDDYSNNYTESPAKTDLLFIHK